MRPRFHFLDKLLRMSALIENVFVVHVVATIAMTGVIWYVQLAHYPLFALVGTAEFERFEAEHVRRTTWVVAPLMLVEGGSLAVLLFLAHPPWQLWLSAAVLAGIWTSTAFVQVPLHGRLQRRRDAVLCRRLVATNWARTVAWTARSGLVMWVSADALAR